MTVQDEIKKINSIDPLVHGKQPNLFVGRPFSIDYNKLNVLICDDDKKKVNGIPQGSFLLAFYDNEETVEEAILIRALNPTRLPTDNAMISSMIEYYKDSLPTTGKDSKLDDFTKYEFSFAGMECRILGTFYRNSEGHVTFGADLENFYSAHHYSVYKVNPDVLGRIVNQRDSPDVTPGNENEFSIGKVRYSSSIGFQSKDETTKVYLNSTDFLGKRTALFGMTRTGKSNSVKKIIECTVQLSNRSTKKLADAVVGNNENLSSYDKKGLLVYPAGQIIFDVNGEYANPNLQDAGTAIYEQYKDQVTRYSVLEKPDFKVLKVNFFKQIPQGFELVKSYLSKDAPDYLKSFLAIDLSQPDDMTDKGAVTRWERKSAAYLCCLKLAGFDPPPNFTVKFPGEKTLNTLVKKDGTINPSKGVSFDQAILWFETIWKNYDDHAHFKNYRNDNDREWADEDLKAVLIMLTKKKKPGGESNTSGYLKLRGIISQHTPKGDEAFTTEIVKLLREGKIVIVDISQGDPDIQRMYSEMLCQDIFYNSMSRFIENTPNNFIQFYFEEAHNLFPQKEDKDLSKIYNRIAKEGAKLNIGMIYATQEVSSISSNILKNTQNWFISHLNNEDEIKELKKYYDFDDFTEALVRFSARIDKGFVRMKTYSNPFVVPVQIDKFEVASKK